MITTITNETFGSFLRRWQNDECFVDFVLSDSELHPRNNSISLILIKFIDDGDTFVLPINHNEANNVNIDLLLMLRSSNTAKYVLEKKKINHAFSLRGNVIDVSLSRYIMDGSTTEYDLHYTKSHTHIYSTQYKYKNLNRAIPVLKWVEWFESVYEEIYPYLKDIKVNSFYNISFLNTLSIIERNGLFVNPNKFTGSDKHISKQGLVHTEYNPFTSTGRPSNRFGGVNFSGLSKRDKSRDAYVSRFEDNGEMVLFDFSAYHPHLLAKLIQYKLPEGNVYEWLGKQYFDKSELTDDEIEEAKIKTFQYFYGGFDKSTSSIPYCAKIIEFTDTLWEYGNVKGYISSPVSKRKIHLDLINDITKQKLLNYLLQLYETEMNILVMNRLNSILSGKSSKLVLYTYDSFLFDINKSENENGQLLDLIVQELNPSGLFPVRGYKGKSYGKLKQIELER